MSWKLRVGLAVAVIAITSGCRLHSPVDEHWSESYEAMAAWQTANPDAPASTEPPESLDPETGKRVAERYYEGQRVQRQRQAPAVVISD